MDAIWWFILAGYVVGLLIALFVIGLVADDYDAGDFAFLAVIWPITLVGLLLFLIVAAPVSLGRWLRDR